MVSLFSVCDKLLRKVEGTYQNFSSSEPRVTQQWIDITSNRVVEGPNSTVMLFYGISLNI